MTEAANPKPEAANPKPTEPAGYASNATPPPRDSKWENRTLTGIGLVLAALSAWFAYRQLQQGPSKGDTIVVNSENSNNTSSTTSTTSTTTSTTVAPAPERVRPITAPPPRTPVQYFVGSTMNYFAVSTADPAVANSVRAAFDIGTTLREISPRFYADGLFRRVMNGDSGWRTGLDVPAHARNLYLIEVGPMKRDKEPANGGTLTARRQIQIVVFDLVNSAVVRTKSAPLTAIAFTEDMLESEFEQQIAEALRQNLSEIVKHEQT